LNLIFELLLFPPHPALSPPACLREAASAKAGERGRVRGNFIYARLAISNEMKKIDRKNHVANFAMLILQFAIIL
jgi:hypothetical protein